MRQILCRYLTLFAVLSFTACSKNENKGPGGFPPTGVVTSKAVMAPFWKTIRTVGTAKGKESISLSAGVTSVVHRVRFKDGEFVRRGQALVDFVGSTLTAPFSGLVGLRQISPGAVIQPGTVITTIDDISEIKLDFSLPETQFRYIEPELEVVATSEAYPGEVFRGKVLNRDSRIQTTTRSFAVRSLFPNDKQKLRPGMLLKIEIRTDQRSSLVIPEEALIPKDDKQFVYLVDKEKTATMTAVKIGGRLPGLVEITSGLKADDLVVVEGTNKLRPNSKVNILNERPTLPENAQTDEKNAG